MKLRNKILSFILALSMIISVIPSMAVMAEDEPPVAVDLIHDSQGKIKEGVFLTCNSQYVNTAMSKRLAYAINGSVTSGWGSAYSSTTTPKWIQINLPVAKRITEIKVVGDSANDFKKNFDILASNDVDFSTSVLLMNCTMPYPSDRTFTVNDPTLLATPYRYIRCVSSTGPFGISEIDVYGIDADAVVSGEVLTDKPDVIAYSTGDDGVDYTAQRAIDGDEDTFYSIASADKPSITLDLRKEYEISKIGVLARGDQDVTGTRANYDILVSNDPTFATYDVAYSRWDASAFGEWADTYGVEGKTYRYVRVQNTVATSGTQGIAEIKVWGTDATGATVCDLAKTASVAATSESAAANLTVDGDVSTGWANGEETGKASITYTFDEPSLVTSFQIFPAYDAEDSSKRTNINVYASKNGTFDDETLITSITDTPLENGRFNNFALDVIDEYKAIKIESLEDPTSASGLEILETRIIYDDSDTAVTVESTIPADGQTGVTNMGESPISLLEVSLNRSVNPSTINPDNIIIRNVTDGTVIEDWTPYNVSSRTFSIDMSKLLSSKEYEVTLTTGVKAGEIPLTEEYVFGFTTGAILNLPYVPGKILVNVAQNKYIEGKAHSSYGAITTAIDGNTSTFVVSNGAPLFHIDLGNIYDIVAVEMVPEGSSGNNGTLLQGMQVLASKDYIDFTNPTAEEISISQIAKYPTDSIKTEVVTLDTPVKARYMGLTRAAYIFLREFKAYAYVDKNFGQWSVNNANVSANGTYTFSIPVGNQDTDANTEYYMIITAYDADNRMLYKDASTVTAVKNATTNLTHSINITDASSVDSITAVLVKSTLDAKMIVDSKSIYRTEAAVVPETQKPEIAATTLEGAVKFTAENDGFTISGKAYKDGYIKLTDRISVQVLEPKSDKTGYDFENVSASDLYQKLCYAKGVGMFKEGEDFEFKFKVADPAKYGEYVIKLTLTREDGTTENLYNYIVYLGAEDILDCVTAFKNFTASDSMEAFLGEWITTRKFFSQSLLVSGLDITSVPAGFNVAFERLCDLYDADGNMTEIPDVIDCLNAAYIVSMLEAGNASALKNAIAKYSGNINGLYDTTANINLDKYSQMYTSLKSNVTDAASLEKVLKWTKALSFIHNGTRDNIQFAIENYNDVLGCDLSYLTTKNVTLESAVMKVNTSNASSYYENFVTAFKNAVDAAAQDNAGIQEPSTIVGGGGMPPVRVPADAKPSVTEPDDKEDEEVITPVTPPKAEMPFGDVANVTWATEHIKSLYEKGIVSGDGDGNFYPDRYVTREEFLKMLVEALEIDVIPEEVIMFKDCDTNGWYFPYIKIALTNKLTSGIDEDNFGIGNNIKRQDMAVLVSKALSLKGVSSESDNSTFGDEETIAKYALTDVKRMSSLGIINGFEDGTFGPNAHTTRAQAAVIIGRALEILGGASK